MGSQTADDAGIVRISDELALVQTVDFFPPMVDDPHWFGRVGAANSISDVWAMGGTPVSAVSVFGLPSDLDPAIGTAILQGALETMEEADPTERLRKMGLAYVKFALENPEYYELMFIIRSPLKQVHTEWSCGMDSLDCLRQTIQAILVTTRKAAADTYELPPEFIVSEASGDQ